MTDTGDITHIDLTEPIDGESTPTPAPTKRGRVRWYHVVVLGIAVLVCAAAVGFFVSQSSDKDDATTERKAADAALADQRGDTQRARDQLADDKEGAETALAKVEQLTTAFRELTDLSAQEIASIHAAHELAVNNPDAVDEYNAEVARGNALIDQAEAKAAEIQRQADALRDEVQAQTVAAVN